MGFFSRKDNVPELPVAPRLPDLPSPYERKELPELPSFPTNDEMVKSAVSENEIPRTREIEEIIPTLPKRMMEEKNFVAPPINLTETERARLLEKDFPRRRVLELNANIENKPLIKQMEPIYVRIDRFHTSKKNFEKIKEKVTEVEKVLRRIKEVKAREEKELDEWSTEIEKLKSRLSEIDSDIFSQI